MERESESFWAEQAARQTVAGFLVGAGLGFAVGVSAALVLAPRPGEVTRAELRRALRRMCSASRCFFSPRYESTEWET